MSLLTFTVFIPAALALFCFFAKKQAANLALAGAIINLALGIWIFIKGTPYFTPLNLQANPLSSGIFMAAAFLTLLVIIYSLEYMKGHERLAEYYAYTLLTLGAAAGALFAGDFLILLIFWGILGALLYQLIGINGTAAAAAASQKSFLIVGGADALMIVGIGIYWLLTKTLLIVPLQIPLNSLWPIAAFGFIFCGAAAKAGVMPFHSWLPDSAKVTPQTVMALLPASLDKLLGIYLITRLCSEVFSVAPHSLVSNLMLAVGSLTIVLGVLAALVQHDFKKLLAFHAVSQAGYMVLGIGTGLPLGVAGGLFHLFNNAIYKTCLFLCGGAVEQKTGTSDLGQLGGLAKFMPYTFAAFLIAALSISGVPPFNGFFSKWMIYQSLLQLIAQDPTAILWLTAALFGSAFTLASFIKLIHAIFLGQWSPATTKASEVRWTMWLPALALAGLCVIFGVFANELPLKFLVFSAIHIFLISGIWSPAPATLLLLLGLGLGGSLYWIGQVKNISVKPVFIGGETFKEETVKVSGEDFYDSITRLPWFDRVYKLAEKKIFDLYELSRALLLSISSVLSFLTNGLLHTYVAWMLLGLMLIALRLMK